MGFSLYLCPLTLAIASQLSREMSWLNHMSPPVVCIWKNLDTVLCYGIYLGSQGTTVNPLHFFQEVSNKLPHNTARIQGLSYKVPGWWGSCKRLELALWWLAWSPMVVPDTFQHCSFCHSSEKTSECDLKTLQKHLVLLNYIFSFLNFIFSSFL